MSEVEFGGGCACCDMFVEGVKSFGGRAGCSGAEFADIAN